MPELINKLTRRAWPTLRLAAQKFMEIDGEQRAAAFAYSAFFAMFPLILLTVSIASMFFDRAAAGNAVIDYAEKYIPLSGDMQASVFNTIAKVIQDRGEAGALAFVMLVWAAAQFFKTMTQAANKAWGEQGHNWWRSPIKNLILLMVMIAAALALVGMAVPMMGKMAAGVLHNTYFFPWAHSLWIFFIPWLLLFFALSLFYRLAPSRPTSFAEVWFPALCATGLLYAAQSLFVIYLKSSPAFNAVYGTFGAIIALMLWIYLSGAIFIFCACLCAAQAATAAQENS